MIFWQGSTHRWPIPTCQWKRNCVGVAFWRSLVYCRARKQWLVNTSWSVPIYFSACNALRLNCSTKVFMWPLEADMWFLGTYPMRNATKSFNSIVHDVFLYVYVSSRDYQWYEWEIKRSGVIPFRRLTLNRIIQNAISIDFHFSEFSTSSALLPIIDRTMIANRI